MNFIELRVSCSDDYQDILLAEISQIGFDSIIEIDGGFQAYIGQELFQQHEVDAVFSKYKSAKISYDSQLVLRQNWNAKWEENYPPILVDDQCIVKAPFHEVEQRYPYEIIITPKMSFGTGHHQTTHQLLSLQLRLDHTDKRVLDAGSGTGILSIMADKRGASHVCAFDIDQWCVESSEENFQLNDCQVCTIQQGDIKQVSLDQSPYEIVIANINKNVLLEEMQYYASHLKAGGDLLLSGFYSNDLDDIKESCKFFGIEYHTHTVKDNWVAAHFVKEN